MAACDISVSGGEPCTNDCLSSKEANVGACTSGACTYEPLGTPIACGITGGTLQIDATYAYVAAPTSLWRVPLAGGPVETLATACTIMASCYGAVAPTPQSLVVDDTNVYFTARDGSLRSMPKSGGASTAVSTAPFQAGAVDAAFVYGVDPTGAYPTVAKVPKGGGATIDLVPVSMEWQTYGVALEGTTLYYNQILTGQVFNGYNNQLLSMPAAGGTPTLVAQQPPSNAWYDLTVQGGYAAWVTVGDLGINSPEACTTSGTWVSFPSKVSCMYCGGTVLAFDGETVFWLAGVSASPAAVGFWIQPISGTGSSLQVGGTQPWGVAVDASTVYIGLDSLLLSRPK